MSKLEVTKHKYETVYNNQLSLNLTLQQENNQIKQNFRGMLQQAFNLDLDLSVHRFIFGIDQISSNRISSYFKLDQYTSLLFQYRLFTNTTTKLEETIQIIELVDNIKFRIFKLVHLELTIISKLTEEQETVYDINLNQLDDSDSFRLTNLSITEQSYLSETIEESFLKSINLRNQLKVHLNTSGIWINKKNFQNRPDSFNFYLILNNFKLMPIKLNFFRADLSNLVDCLVELYNKSLEIQKQIDIVSLRYGEVILNFNDLLFETGSRVMSLESNLEETPFDLDPVQNRLVFTQLSLFNANKSYQLNVLLNRKFNIILKLIPKKIENNFILFDSHMYNIDISYLDFTDATTLIIQKLNAFYYNEKSGSIYFQFAQLPSTSRSDLLQTKQNLLSLLKLNSQTGEIELVKSNINVYLNYCTQTNRLKSAQLALLYTIKAIDKNTNSEAKTLIRLNIKCDLVKDTFEFERAAYYKTIVGTTKPGTFITRINLNSLALNDTTKVTYYFCELKMNSALLNSFSLNQKTGDVHLNNILTNSFKMNYLFDVCASVENKFVNKIVKTTLKISLQNAVYFEFELFNNNSIDLYEIDVPISTFNSVYKLFQFKTNTPVELELETAYPDVFQLNSSDSWLSLNLPVCGYNEYYVKLIAKNFKTLNFKFRLIQLNTSSTYFIDLNYFEDKHFDLKSIFNSNYKFFVLETNPFVYYNSTNGFIYLNKTQLNRKMLFNLKLVSLESDLTVATVQLSPLSEDAILAKTNQTNSLFISKYSSLNSIIYKLTENSEKITHLIELNEQFFSIGNDHQTIYLSQSLVSHQSDKMIVLLITSHHSITLNIYIIENLYEKLDFKLLSYYFIYSTAENDAFVGSIELNKNYMLLNKVNDQIKFNSFRIAEQKCFTSDRIHLNQLFYLNNIIDLSINTSRIEEISCQLYELSIEAQFNNKSLFTKVFIELNSQNWANKITESKSFTIVVNRSEFSSNGWKSLNVFNFIKKSNDQILLTATLLVDDQKENSAEFSFSSSDGILSFNPGEEKVLNFVITYFIRNNLIQKFELNIFVNDDSNQTFLTKQIIECELNYRQSSRIFNDNLMILDLNRITYNSFSYASNFSLARSLLSRLFYINENKIYFSSNSDSKNQRFLFNFTNLLQVNSCGQNDSCEKIVVYLKFNVLESNKIDLINEYYSLVNKQLVLNSASYFKTINLVRIRDFNSQIPFILSLNKKSNIFQMNNFTKVLSVQSENFNENMNPIQIIYEPDRRLIFNLSLQNSDQIFTDLTIDLFLYNSNKIGYQLYLGDLAFNKHRQACEIWTDDAFVQDKLSFLNDSCDLMFDLESADSIKKHQLKFQVRIYDKSALSRSVFFMLKINLFKMDLKKEKLLLIKLANKTKLNNLNKLMKTKLNCVIVDERQRVDSQLILIRTIDSEFSKGLVVKVSQFFENAFGFDNFELILPIEKHNCNYSMLYFQSSLTEEIFQFYASNFSLEYKRTLDSNQYALIVPDFKFETKNMLYTKNSIKFEKFSYLVYESTAVRVRDYLWIRFLFKTELKSSFLFNLKSVSSYLHFQINDLKIEILHNNQSAIKFEDSIEINEWYEFEMQLNNTRSTVIFRKISQMISTECVYFSQKYFDLNEFKYEVLTIGSILSFNSSTVKFYSDRLEMADFKLNSYQLFDEKFIKKHAKKVLLPHNSQTQYSTCQLDIYSSNCTLGKRI